MGNPPAQTKRLPDRRRWWTGAGCLLAVGLIIRQSLRFEWKLDDAYIAFAYAQNWVQGHGLVFNVGERVEGYTCFLWVALSAVGLALGVDIVRWSTALGIGSAVATVIVTWRLTCELAPPHRRELAVVSAVLVGGYPAFGWWAASGMETALFALLVTAAIWRHVRHGTDSLAAPVCLALASMTRPEGWLLSGVLCLDALRLGPSRKAAGYLALFLAIFAPYYAWRCWYYGYPLPNTFYAKVGSTPAQVQRGCEYLRKFLIDGGAVLMLAALAALWSGIGRRLVAVWVFLAAYLGYVVLVGGDVFFFHRFLVPVVPLMAAFAVAGLVRWADRLMPTRPLIASACCGVYAALFALSCVGLYRAQATNLPVVRTADAIQRGTCLYLREHTTPTEAIATVGVGQIKFCTGRPVIDMVGLTDKHIAHQDVSAMGQGLAGHEKYDSQYVLARWPKYFIIPPMNRSMRVEAVDDMWRQPLFQRYYVADEIGYRRRDVFPKP